MKFVRSALVAVVTLAGGAAAIQGGMAYAAESARTAQATGGCFITVEYKDAEGQTKTKTTCINGGERQCNSLQNNFCAPIDHPEIISRTCNIVPSCPDTP